LEQRVSRGHIFSYQLSALSCDATAASVHSFACRTLTADSWQLSVISKLHSKTCALDATHRHAVHPSPFFEQQVAAVYARQPSGEGRLAVNRFGRYPPGPP